jgi:hypothetical protein
MRAEIVTLTDLRIGRIQDKTRWTKALGEAATVVYGDCNHGSAPSKHRRAGDRVTRAAFKSTCEIHRLVRPT